MTPVADQPAAAAAVSARPQEPLLEARRQRSPELDGLRGIAVLMVVEIHHGFLGKSLDLAGLSVLKPVAALGWSGVDLFFVLSGFLLGGILLDNKDSPSYFKPFYIRRVCRTFPLYFLVVIPLLLLAPVTTGGHSLFADPLPPWTYLTYTQNFAMAAADSGGSVWLAPTWSLAVEEQFYLVLPLLIWIVPRPKLPYLLVGLTVAGTLSRLAIIAAGGGVAQGVLLPSRAEPLLLGVLAAWALRNESCVAFIKARMSVMYGVLVALIAGAALLVLVGGYGRVTPTQPNLFPATYGYAFLGLLFTCAVLIAVTERRGLVSFVTRNPLLGKLGVIGYGTYLFQLPVHGVVSVLASQALAQPPSAVFQLAVSVVSMTLTIALASLSWLFFEKRIINWGRSFAYDEGARSARG